MPAPNVWAVVALVAALAVTGCDSGNGDHGGGGASCAAPALGAKPFRARPEAGPVTVRPGHSLKVYGRFYTDDCFDTGGARKQRPVPEVRLALVTADHRVTELATVHPAGPEFSFVARVHIPDGATPGRARIDDRRSPRASLPVVVRSR